MSIHPRRTLAAPTALLTGVGLHTGNAAAVQILPADAGRGIVFRELGSGQEIAARAENVVDTSRCTILGRDSVTVQTVEHLLSALAGVGIHDAWIESRGGELPAMDGSAAPFTAALLAAGIQEEGDGEAFPLRLDRPLLLTGEGGSAVIALPARAFHATVVLEYPKHPWIGVQAVEFNPVNDDYAAEIAPARTYGFLTEIAWLQERGLALGASYENGIALRDDGYDTPLRFEDELARHKLLDLIGDLALVGCPLAARVIAIRPSHALNCRFARLLAEAASAGVN